MNPSPRKKKVEPGSTHIENCTFSGVLVTFDAPLVDAIAAIAHGAHQNAIALTTLADMLKRSTELKGLPEKLIRGPLLSIAGVARPAGRRVDTEIRR